MTGTSEEEAQQAAARLASPSPDDGERPSAQHPALDDARLHRDEHAAQVTDALGAQAVTIGRNVFLSPAAPPLETTAGRRLLAHELTHVVQQAEFGARPQRFTAGERSRIATDLTAMMSVVEALVNASSRGDHVNMDALVRNVGGSTAASQIPVVGSPDPPTTTMLRPYRYIFTSRCGLVDLKHFIQLMYISWFGNMGNASMAARGATRRGVEHERASERSASPGERASAFAPEDLTSNALGAWTASQLAVYPQRPDVIARIRETLEMCGPVDFAALSPTSRDAVVNFYSATTSGGEALNQNRTAVALIPTVPELAAHDRSFPFSLDTDDSSGATLDGPDFRGGSSALTGDSDIRDFVSVQRDSVLSGLSQAERLRLCSRLMRGWVSDEDVDAFSKLYRLGDTAARGAIRAAVPPGTLSGGQSARLRALYVTHP